MKISPVNLIGKTIADCYEVGDSKQHRIRNVLRIVFTDGTIMDIPTSALQPAGFANTGPTIDLQISTP